MQNPRPRGRLSWGKFPLLRRLHGLPGKIFTGPAETKLALSTFPEASTKTFIRILMVPLIVFCADLDTTGETCCRTPPGLAFPAGAVLATVAGAEVGAGVLALWRSLRALVAEGLAASAA